MRIHTRKYVVIIKGEGKGSQTVRVFYYLPCFFRRPQMCLGTRKALFVVVGIALPLNFIEPLCVVELLLHLHTQ